jgi:putative heme-binding domain-containing protein
MSLSQQSTSSHHCRAALWVLLLLTILHHSHGQLANRPPSPAWLQSSPSEMMEKTFQHHGPLLMAVLLIAADEGAEVWVNDVMVLTATGAAKAQSVDVTKHMRSGDNTLRISSTRRTAVMLELNGDFNRKTWIITDDSWTGGTQVATIDLSSPDQPFDFKQTFDAYNSWQLAKADTQRQATLAQELSVPPGFEVQLIRSAGPEEGSWVAMAFDPNGRLTLAREKRGLLRLTLTATGGQQMEVIEDTLLECRGLLYAHGSLFANANNTKALLRLDDTDGDGVYETKKELMRTSGGVGHGRNHIKLGPDGAIYVAHGNNVVLPTVLAHSDWLKKMAQDQLMPNPWDGKMFDGDVQLPAGHILRVSPDGSDVQVIAGGLRNPLDIAFNQRGDLFTFDADMERDIGTHFYMPTRVLHIVPGADYGWRRGTGRWPHWYIDTLPSVVDVGLSSPTAIFFGYGAAFPERYRNALYVCDWSYGRLIAVHLTPHGKSYRGKMENFATGRPLNLTDGVIGPDGALWFITGGRSTQSGLYRIHYTGEKTRHTEEGDTSPEVPEVDRFALHHRRMQLEEQPNAIDLTPGKTWESAMHLTAAARSGQSRLVDHAVTGALTLLLSSDADLQLAGLRITEIAISRGHALTAVQRASLLKEMEARFPAADARLSRELCKFLVYLKSDAVIDQTCQHLRHVSSSEDLVYYPFMLRYLKTGWSVMHRRVVFEALNRAEKLNGASTYFKVISDTRSEHAAALSAEEARELAAVIHLTKPTPLMPTALPSHSFRAWTLTELEPHLSKVTAGRDFAGAKAALVTAQCVFCHKVSADSSVPAGVFGPDLLQVRSRFSTRDLLLHTLEPSLVVDEKFQYTTIKRIDGQTFTGLLDSEDDERVTLKPNPLGEELIEIGKSMIHERHTSGVSPMPTGLLNTLKRDQILDLLAWFEAGGDPKSAVWQKAE